MPGRLSLAIAGIVLALALMADRWRGHSEDAQVSAQAPGEKWVAAMDGGRPNTGGSKDRDKPSRRTAIGPPHPPALAQAAPTGRNASATFSEKRSALQHWQAWKKLLVESRRQQIPIVGAALAKSIRRHPDALVYDQINRYLAGTALSTENKALLLDLLSDIATPEALDILLGLADGGKSSATYFLVLLAIARMGDNRWGGEFHEELSPALERAWVDPDISEPLLVATLAETLAKVGAPEGVDLLLQTLTVNDNGKQKPETVRARQEAALLAVPQTRNPDAVPVLSEWLRNGALGTAALEVSGEALAAIGTPEAIGEIEIWAKQAPDEGARYLDAWLSKTEDDRALQAISAVPVESFQSQEVGAVVKKFALDVKP